MAWQDTDKFFKLHEAATGTLDSILTADVGTLIIEDSGKVVYFNSEGDRIVVGSDVSSALNTLVTNLTKNGTIVTGVSNFNQDPANSNTYKATITHVDPSTGVQTTTEISLTVATGAVEEGEVLPVSGDAVKAAIDSAVETLNATITNKVASVSAGDGIEVTGDATAPVVAVKLAEGESVLSFDAAGGLKATIPAATDYTVTMESSAEGVYVFSQLGKELGTINIPKDMVVSGGVLETDPEGQEPGTYLVLTIANASEDKIYINLTDLIDIDNFILNSEDSDTIDITIESDVQGSYTISASLTDAFLQQVASDIETAKEAAIAAAASDATSKADAAQAAAEATAKAYTDAALTIKRYEA